MRFLYKSRVVLAYQSFLIHLNGFTAMIISSRIISSTTRYAPSSLLKKKYIPSKRPFYKEYLRVFHSTHTLLFSTTPENSEPTKKSKLNKKKLKLGDPSKVDLNALTAAFDEMAKRDEFDESTAFYADGDTFEDEFEYDNLDDEKYDD